MFKKASEFINKANEKTNAKMIEAQANMMANDGGLKSRAGLKFLTGCAVLSGAAVPAFAGGGAGGGTASDIAAKIREGVGNAYGAMKSIGVVVAAVGVALAAFYLFTGGDKGMEKAKKTILYTVLGCGILFLAVPIVNFIAGLFSGASDGFASLGSY